MPHVMWFNECSLQHLGTVGGKCASLGEMLKAGIPVPPGFAISTRAYEYFLSQTGLGDQVRSLIAGCDAQDLPQLESVSEQIRGLIYQTPVPRPLQDEIQAAYRRLAELCGHGELPVAVRSSATGEDSPEASFAGLHETYLWVRSDQVLDSARACWASLYTPRAIAYRLRLGLDKDAWLLSVGVQQMVAPRAAGVMFTLDPTNGDPSQVAIEASWGLGESVVRGEVTPDRYRVDKVTLEITEQVVSHKTVEYVPNPVSGGVIQRQVPGPRQAEPCLLPDEVVHLATLGKRIERYYGRPQDIEWAIDHRLPFPDAVKVVQSRAETVWSRKPRQIMQAPAKDGALGYVTDFLIRNVGPAKRSAP